MNRLAGSTSPYLRQHEGNPVDWYPWGAEALEAARRRDVPLFVSIGYSACHWCHVMAHESFEDEETARALNEGFVAVKVDREERPDLDALYLDAVQAMTGSGGWPLSVFATPEGRPFFGGTYFPGEARHRMPSFRTVLEAVATAWATRRDELNAQADELTEVVRRRIGEGEAGTGAGERPASERLLRAAVERFAALYDPENGGIGSAPKFAQAPMLELLLRAGAAGLADVDEMVATTLGAIASGGIYDHLGGGFARYSVDRAWLVPHFEKMLYDQAALGRVYLHAFQATGEPRWRQVVEETVAYVLRDLDLGPAGIASSEDADAEGVEGRFASWTPDELVAVLGEDEGRAAAAFYGVVPGGHLEDHRSVLHRPDRAGPARDGRAEAWRAALFAAREARVRPGRDEKAVTEWNAMWCAFLAEAAGALDVAPWRDRAVALGELLARRARRADGRYLRSLGGTDDQLAVCGDYAWLVEAYTRLGECTGEARWSALAREAAEALVVLFSAEDGGWYTTGADAEALVVRPRETSDGVVPSGGSAATVALARLAALAGDEAMRRRAEAGLDARCDSLAAAPLALAHLVWAAELLEAGPVEVVVAGEAPELVSSLQHRFLPTAVLAWGEPTDSPLWEGRRRPTGAGGLAYVCERGACRSPVGERAGLDEALGRVLGRRPGGAQP